MSYKVDSVFDLMELTISILVNGVDEFLTEKKRERERESRKKSTKHRHQNFVGCSHCKSGPSEVKLSL